MGLLERLQASAVQSLLPARNRLGAIVAFAAISALLLGAHWLAGPYPITLYPQDTLHNLVEADYLSKGYAPHVDYTTPYGVLPYLFAWAGLAAEGVSLKAILLAQILAAILFGGLLFAVALGRLSGFWAVLCGVGAELILVSPSPLGEPVWKHFSAAMFYNVIGFVLLATLLLSILLPRPRPTARTRIADSAIEGMVLAALLLTKASFFLAALPLFAAARLLWADSRARAMALGSVAACAAAVLGFSLVLHDSIPAYARFLLAIPSRVSTALLPLRYVQYTRTLSLLLVAIAMALYLLRTTADFKACARIACLSILAVAAFLVAASTSAQTQEALPLVGVVPLSIGGLWARRQTAPLAPPVRAIAAFLALASLLLIAEEPKNGLLSLAFCRMKVRTLDGAAQRPLGPPGELPAGLPLRDSVDRRIFAMLPAPYVESLIVSPLRLLAQARCGRDDVLYVCHPADTVTLFTTMRYPKGGSPWYGYLDFIPDSRQYPLIRTDFLSDTQWILRSLDDPRCWEFLMYHRKDYVAANFERVGWDGHWELYGRRPAGNRDAETR